MYAAKAPYEDILTAARAAEAELEDYKEVEGATSKAAQAPHQEVMEQLASIQAVVKKAWNAQQNSQQKRRKQGDGKKDNNNNPSGKKKRSDTCYGCGGKGHFIKDCPNPHKSSLNFKRGERSPRPPLLQPRRRQKHPAKQRILLQKRNRPQRMGQNRFRTSGTNIFEFCSI